MAPMTPALHCSITSLGLLMMNSGEPMMGSGRFARTAGRGTGTSSCRGGFSPPRTKGGWSPPHPYHSRDKDQKAFGVLFVALAGAAAVLAPKPGPLVRR